MNPESSPIRKRRLSPEAGKANFELQQLLTRKLKFPHPPLLYVTLRKEIEKGDTRRFVHSFRPKLKREELLGVRQSVIFTVEGFDDVNDPLFTIPEVRNFYAKCHEAWPCWSYFSELKSDCLAVIAACATPNISVVRHRRRKKVEVTQTQAELIELFEYGLPASAILHHKAGIGKQQGMMFLRDVSYYLRLPEIFSEQNSARH